MKYITVFTPTFNRGHTLSRVYESLKTQSFKDFEWIIVDDGSTDNTKQIVDIWKRDSPFFSIRYFYQENQGKHVATNVAVKNADGKMFITLDSDDGCKPNSFRILVNTWESISESNRQLFKGVSCRCCSINDPETILGTPFSTDSNGYHDSNDNVIRLVEKVTGELWGMTRTEVLRGNPYPEIEGLHFYPENVYWGRIGQCYSTRYINAPLRYYYIGENEQTTQSINPKELFYQRKYYIRDLLKEYFTYDKKFFVKQAVGLIRDGLLSERTLSELIRVPNSLAGRFLVLCALPVGGVLYLREKHGKRNAKA